MKSIINRKKFELALLLVVIFQILLLMNLPAADSYMIGQTNAKDFGSKIIVKKTGFENLVKAGLNLLTGILSIKQIGLVSAEYGDEPYCCLKTNNGNYCVDIIGSGYGNCAENILTGSCDYNECWSCCPETKGGQLCQDVAFNHPEECSMDLVSGTCEENTCLSCCTEIISDNKSEDNFCVDTSRWHSICEDPLVFGSCNQNNCRVLGLNQVEIGQQSSSGGGSLSLACCPETNSGAICQNVISGYDNCAEDVVPTRCETYSDCKIGCCIDEEQGLCTTKATKQKCELNGGIWKDEENCLVTECQKGCCVLGSNVDFATDNRCAWMSSLYGFEKDFRDYSSEISCLALAATQLKGACLLDGGACEFATEQECLNMAGTFFQDTLCSNPSLNSTCDEQTSIGCVEGKDEIYWFDSCGNQENIYSSDKDASWNNGEVLSKEESCGYGESNADSTTCGNCNYFLGSKCAESSLIGTKVEDGDFVCESMNCIDDNGVERKNGESWCVYDSYIGEGKDTAGSRHWKRMCIDGEIKIEPCADYRGGICAQSELESGGETFTTATCVVNEALRCIGYNSEKDMEEKCKENPDCMIKSVNIADKFKFDICVGEYPRGFDLDYEYGAETSEDICGMASMTCDVVWQKDWKGSWSCIENCACESGVFATQMNDLCVSLGDCGSYINYLGKGTDNSRVSGAAGISWKDYSKYSESVEGKYAEPKDIREFLGAMGGTSVGVSGDEQSGFEKAVGMIGTVSGGLGVLLASSTVQGIAGSMFASSTTAYGTALEGAIASGAGETAATETAQIAGANSVSATMEAFGYAAIGAAVGAYVGSYIAQELGISGDAAAVMTVAGTVAGAVAGYTYATTGSLQGLMGFAGLGPVFWVAIIVMIYIAIIGWGQTEIHHVEFQCMPWQAPLGGSDCDKCDDDAMKPCSEYRCDSLGAACEILNENTENPICESLPNDGRPPVISTNELREGYSFEEISAKSVKINEVNSIDECITEFTPVNFSLETDEYSQCRFDFGRTKKYDEMKGYPLEQTRFSKEHNFIFSMPSIGSFEVYNVSGDLKEMFGNLNMYVRCRDYHGNTNVEEFAVNFCVNSEPDRTAVSHAFTKTEPESGSFIAYNQTEEDLTIWLNEPAECKYDLVGNKSYDTMANTMECKTKLEEIKAYGWECNTTLTNLGSGTNNFYIKCKDKPWVVTQKDIDKYEERNVNEEAFVYTLYGSDSMLRIDYVLPEGTIENGFEPISVDLEVKTSGGSDKGEATCYYSFPDYEQENQFYETFSRFHKQNFNLMRGDYTFNIRCEDSAGNVVSEDAIFTLDIDSAPPEVIRAYKEGSSLKLETDEEAECFYSYNNCFFNIDNSSSTSQSLSKTHSVEWTPGKTYHIKCRDIWGNSNTDCTIKVSPSFFE